MKYYKEDMQNKKGDIVIIRFPFSDLSKTKKRPALIISNDIINKTGDFLMVQITSKLRKDDFTLKIDQTDFKNNKELPLQSYVRLHKIFLLNDSLILSKYTSVNDKFLRSVTDKIIKFIK